MKLVALVLGLLLLLASRALSQGGPWVEMTRKNMRAVMPPNAECVKGTEPVGTCSYKSESMNYSVRHGMDSISGTITYPIREKPEGVMSKLTQEDMTYVKRFGDLWSMYGLDRQEVSECFKKSKMVNDQQGRKTDVIQFADPEIIGFAQEHISNKQYILTCVHGLDRAKQLMIIYGGLAVNNRF